MDAHFERLFTYEAGTELFAQTNKPFYRPDDTTVIADGKVLIAGTPVPIGVWFIGPPREAGNLAVLHARCNHISVTSLKRNLSTLTAQELGLKVDFNEKVEPCVPCSVHRITDGPSRHASVPMAAREKREQPVLPSATSVTIYADHIGPYSPTSYNGNSYALVCIAVFTEADKRYNIIPGNLSYVAPMQNLKAATTVNAILTFTAWLRTHGHAVDEVLSDMSKAGLADSNELQQRGCAVGLKIRPLAPRTKNTTARVDVHIRWLKEAMQCSLTTAAVSTQFWDHSLSMASAMHNDLPSTTNGGNSPNALFGIQGCLAFRRVPFCYCVVFVPEEPRGQGGLNPRGIEALYLGTDARTGLSRCFDANSSHQLSRR